MEDLVQVEVTQNPDARGIAVILCNDYIGVINSKKDPLYGSKKDASEMESTFKHIKFAVIRMDNATRDTVLGLIKGLASYKFPDFYKSIVFIFSGHGNGKPAIISNDDMELDLNKDIINPLGNSETLEGKNKIAFITACRVKGVNDKPLDVQDKFLVAFSTSYGTHSVNVCVDNGCPWMQKLAKEIKMSSLPIDEVLRKVNKEVKEITGQNSQFINTSVGINLGQGRGGRGGSHGIVRGRRKRTMRAEAITTFKRRRDEVAQDAPCIIIASEEVMVEKASEDSDHNSDDSVLTNVNDSTLSLDDDLGDVVDAVEPLARKWRRLCTKLRLKHSTLDVIEGDNPGDVCACLHKALVEWLRLNYDYQRHGRPSWKRLAEAVSSFDSALSEKITTMHMPCIHK